MPYSSKPMYYTDHEIQQASSLHCQFGLLFEVRQHTAVMRTYRSIPRYRLPTLRTLLPAEDEVPAAQRGDGSIDRLSAMHAAQTLV